jgi:hypothetical protein
MKKVIIIGIALLLFLSCYTEFDLSNEIDDTGPVVSAFIANDSLIKVNLYKVIGTNEASKKVFITDASVELYENNVEVEDLVLDFNTGINSDYDTLYFYTSVNTFAHAEKKYSLEITTSDGVLTTCETIIPKPVEILSVDTTFLFVIDTLSNSYDKEEYFRIRFKDPFETNFYRITLNNRFGHNIGNDTINVFEMADNSFGKIDTLFSYFGEDEENEFFSSSKNNFLIFNDKLINGMEYELQLHRKLSDGIYYEPQKGEFTQYIIELHSLTEDGYNYLKAVDLQSQSDGIIKEPVLSYTNIENGVGIFTGYSASQKIITIGEYPVEGVVYQ